MKKLFYILILFLSGCSVKKESSDPESLPKDPSFRSTITTGQFVELTAGYTYYELSNPQSDTLLVMVHGFSVPSYIWDSTYYEAVKRGYGALRYDTYGRGFSDNPDVVYDVALFSQQLKELLDTLHINQPVNLMGLSDGGRTISVFAFQNPTRIRNLIYVDAAGFNDMPPKDSTVSPLVTDEEIQQFKQSERYASMAAGQLGDFYDSTRFRGWDKKYAEVMRYKGFVRALMSTNKNRASLEKEHRGIAAEGTPVFAIWGENDTVVKLEEVKGNLIGRIPKVQLYVIPKAGHLPHMEDAPTFNRILFDSVIRRSNR